MFNNYCLLSYHPLSLQVVLFKLTLINSSWQKYTSSSEYLTQEISKMLLMIKMFQSIFNSEQDILKVIILKVKWFKHC